MKQGGSAATCEYGILRGDEEMMLSRDCLWDILSVNKTKEEKKEVLKRTLGVVDDSLEKEVSVMCDYASVVANYGIELGIRQGIEQGIRQGVEQGIRQGVEQGIRQGKHLGEIRSIVSVYSDGLITLDYALSKTGLDKETFLNAVSLWKSGKLDDESMKLLF